jgi:hypothetical protein
MAAPWRLKAVGCLQKSPVNFLKFQKILKGAVIQSKQASGLPPVILLTIRYL